MTRITRFFKTILVGWALSFHGVEMVSAQTLIVHELCVLPSSISETSGFENGPNGWFWTHNDSGNPAQLFAVDSTGVIHHTVEVSGDLNTDWEDLAKDPEGNLYIGNFGNNTLDRSDLRIVKIPSIDTCTVATEVSDTIFFAYPDQYDLPPVGGYGNFDMEAFFWYQDSLHLFSKDRSNPYSGHTKHYTLPDHAGTYTAMLKDSMATGGFSYLFSVTAADISEDGQTVVLLNSDKLWLCTDYLGTDFFGGEISELSLGTFSQKEAVCFRNGFIYITDEASFGLGGKMYRLDPALFVSVKEGLKQEEAFAVYNDQFVLQSITLKPGMTATWKLYSLDGRLLDEGVSTDSIAASRFGDRHGVFVLRIMMDGRYKALEIRL